MVMLMFGVSIIRSIEDRLPVVGYTVAVCRRNEEEQRRYCTTTSDLGDAVTAILKAPGDVSFTVESIHSFGVETRRLEYHMARIGGQYVVTDTRKDPSSVPMPLLAPRAA